MKKILFYAFLAITVKAYTQGNESTLYLLHPNTHQLPIQNIQTVESWNNISGSNPANVLNGDDKKQVVKQASVIQIFDSIYYWSWDTTQNFGWKYKYKTIGLLYDSNTNLSHKHTQMWYGNTWIDGSQDSYSYDAVNNLTSVIEELWYNNVWENYSQTIYTYDANNNNIGRLSCIWDSYGSAWRNRNQYLWTYDANNNILSETYQTWFQNAWLNDRSIIYVYDGSNNLTSAKDQIWNGSSWNDQHIKFYTYNLNNRLIHILEQGYTSNGLIDLGKYDYSYDSNNNLIYATYTDFDGSSWKEITQSFYAYDSNNNRISQLDKNWNWTENAMLKSRENNTTYDIDNFKQSLVYSYYNSAGNFTSRDSTYYYFHTKPSGIYELQEANISLYPNPANGKFTICSKNHISSVDIFNVQGVRIYEDYKLNQQTSKEIDLSNLPKGIYIIRLSCGLKNYIREIIIE